MAAFSAHNKSTKRNNKRSRDIKGDDDSMAMLSSSSSTTYAVTTNGGTVRRIRTPHPHDVLSGRGGGINSHAGNVQFRDWVRVRKNDYNLAQSKHAKALVAQEVIKLVQNQSPPGRFLQKDPSSVGGMGWWIEIDDEKIMAKTSQALREGAPQIRAAHADDFKKSRQRGVRKEAQHEVAVVKPQPVVSSNQQPATIQQQQQQKPVKRTFGELTGQIANLIVKPTVEARSEKRVRVSYNGQAVLPSAESPPLAPVTSATEAIPSLTTSEFNDATTPPLLSLPDDLTSGDDFQTHAQELSLLPPPALAEERPAGGRIERSHSLALSTAGYGDADDEFVNPFGPDEDNDPIGMPLPSSIMRDVSTASDMAGLGALLDSEAATSTNRATTSTTAKTSPRAISNLSNNRCVDDTVVVVDEPVVVDALDCLAPVSSSSSWGMDPLDNLEPAMPRNISTGSGLSHWWSLDMPAGGRPTAVSM